ncbi:hypothetical protein PH505_bm00350 [Pseudoalteromonas distincta]|nr:hypothetical protein PH505_bm00350 [Pseudoalteromonas distincta]
MSDLIKPKPLSVFHDFNNPLCMYPPIMLKLRFTQIPFS